MKWGPDTLKMKGSKAWSAYFSKNSGLQVFPDCRYEKSDYCHWLSHQQIDVSPKEKMFKNNHCLGSISLPDQTYSTSHLTFHLELTIWVIMTHANTKAEEMRPSPPKAWVKIWSGEDTQKNSVRLRDEKWDLLLQCSQCSNFVWILQDQNQLVST